MVDTLDKYVVFSQFVRDPELYDIMNRQYMFIQDTYNITVQSFQTGQDPSHPTQQYKMKQNNNVVYGLQQSAQPKQPIQTLNEMNDQKVSCQLLGTIKSDAGFMAQAGLEVTNPVVRRVIQDSVPNFMEMAYELFLYQNKNNYYQVPQLQRQDIQTMTSAYAPYNGQPPTMGLNQ
ncbi:spore coat protein [Bacillus sp. HMF5848]|nr:spore coat protein [Bacillus sp. HMF5848]